MLQLIEISEPIKLSEETNNDIAIGIDFGTTNSLVAFCKNGHPYVIDMVKSIVGIDESGRLVVAENGMELHSHAEFISESFLKKEREILKQVQDDKNPSAHNKNIASIKRFLAHPDSLSKKITIGGKEFTPIEISSVILSHLKHKAEEHLETKVTKAVITVPAYFDDISRNAVISSANMAGLEVMRLINEPTAAAFSYGLDNKAEGIYLVYDLGGGTFDVSVLNMRMGVFQVLSVGGDNMLGGDDIDDILEKNLIAPHHERIRNSRGYPTTDGIAAPSLIDGNDGISPGINLARPGNDARSLKEQLSYNENVDGISRSDFEEAINPIIKRTIDIANSVMLNSERDIDGIILVGGSTRIPMIKRELKKIFDVEIFDDVDPDKVVALGAALQAENLTSKGRNLLIDVLPLSLGIEIMGGLNEKIILRNSPIPTKIIKTFTTHIDNQTAMSFHIIQGEREMASDCRSLGKFELKNIPPMKAGTAKINLSFAIDADGIASISASEEISGMKEEFQLKPGYGITYEKTIEMLQEAYKNAEEDHIKRLVKETLFKSENALTNLYKALEESPELLSEEERERLSDAMNSLLHIMNKIQKQEHTDIEMRNELIAKLNAMNKESDEFFMRRLNKGLENAIKGKKITEVRNVD